MQKIQLLTVACAFCANTVLAETLPSLNLDPAATTVSGLSSGAFMAVQLQVAFSNSIAGVGVIAGGPFNCADHSIYRALNVCMNPLFVEADPANSVAAMQGFAAKDSIDPLDGITIDRIYMFHGKADDTVAQATMDALAQMYLSLNVPSEAMEYVKSVEAGHGFMTGQDKVACTETQPNFLIDCGIDQAGDMLNWLYGELAEPVAPQSEGLLTFKQSLYTEGAMGMDTKAFVYVPADCANGELCRLHIALHGCKQGREIVEKDFAQLAGFNRWAEANKIVILYPQAVEIPAPWWNWFSGNPNGCWDWWGYSGSDYLTRTAPQPSAIARMARALGAPLTP